jgi:DNA-binding NtrC family response regulator
MPGVKLTPDAVQMIQAYNWPGNIRQLKNLVEQLSVIETAREITGEILSNYLTIQMETMPTRVGNNEKNTDSFSEREIMYKFLLDMKKDLTDLKKLVVEIMQQGGAAVMNGEQSAYVSRLYQEVNDHQSLGARILPAANNENFRQENNANYPILDDTFEVHEEVEESLSLEDREKELINKALEKHRGKRKYAAAELGISERTLYRKIKEYNLDL